MLCRNPSENNPIFATLYNDWREWAKEKNGICDKDNNKMPVDLEHFNTMKWINSFIPDKYDILQEVSNKALCSHQDFDTFITSLSFKQNVQQKKGPSTEGRT